MTTKGIGERVFSIPVNEVYNLMHDSCKTASQYTLFTLIGTRMLNLGGHRACQNMKMCLYPAVERALNSGK